MEQLNRIELRGVVGNIQLRTYNGRQVANISVATSRAFKNQAGEPVIDTTWHNVTVWEGRINVNLSHVGKGSKVHVIGRLSTNRFTGSDGIERTGYEVSASVFEVIDDPSPLAYEA